uniref:Uncharacterized protein n=1 Tax=Megaselia scalaris TaxID=36166 RepID=T1H1X6_MEGSC
MKTVQGYCVASFKERKLNFNDDIGRAKLAEFLYNEYSLEQVIYQLAKEMFTQSLTKGSDDAQKSLQKLTHVILASLSDTLEANPELLKSRYTKSGVVNKERFLRK